MTLGWYWAKTPKTEEDLINYGKHYNNAREYKLGDKKSYSLSLESPLVTSELKKYWDSSHYDKKTEEYIELSKKKYRMADPNDPNGLKTIPRFNYDKLREVGVDYTIPKQLMVPVKSLFCNKHKIYFPETNNLRFTNHLYSQGDHSGCPECGKDSLRTMRTLEKESRTLEDYWIPKFKENPANRYPSYSKYKDELKFDYSESWLEMDTEGEREYQHIHNIKCKIHNVTFGTGRGIRVSTHKNRGGGCPKCSGSESIGEDNMNGILVNIYGNQDMVLKNKTFPNLVFKNQLRFDRYVEVENQKISFEFDGEQHFKKYEFFNKDETSFYEAVARDVVKNNYCKQNNIKLIRIGYIDSNNMEIEIKNALENPSQMVLSSRYPQLGWNTPDMEKNDPYLYRYLKQFKVIGESDLKLMNLI
jgi:hypothetical protein